MNTKGAFIVLLLLLPTATLWSAKTVSVATVWTVDDDGPADFHTVQEAVDVAATGDTVFVHSGTYYESLYINKTLTLFGENPLTTIVDAQGRPFLPVIRVRANNVVIMGFTIRNGTGIWGPELGGVEMRCSSGCRIENCIIVDTPYGINLLGSSGNIICNNLLTGNGIGIQLLHCIDEPIYSCNNTISGNWMLNNTLFVRGPQWGFEIGQYCNNNTLFDNCFLNNSAHIDSTRGNLLYHNNFAINSTLEIYQRGAAIYYPDVALNDEREGNFWIDYSGVDENGDRIGDSPYIVGGANRDNFPLMRPYKWLQGDIDLDMKVNIVDIATIAKTYSSQFGDSDWNPRYDLNNDKNINILDIALAAANFDKQMTWQPA